MADERGQNEDETSDQTRQSFQQEESQGQSGEKNSPGKSKKIVAVAVVGAAATAVGVVAAPVIAGAALGAAGFTSAGVTAGSIAAGIQSAVYGGSVTAGSIFALCQSAGATGVIGSAATVAIGGSTGLAGIAATLGSFKLFGKGSNTIKLVVCGRGDGAHVFAGIASSREDADVRVLSLHQDEAERWDTAMQAKDLKVTLRCKEGGISGTLSKPTLVTKNPNDAMRDAEFVVLVTEAVYPRDYLEALKPFITPGTIIVGLPGYQDFGAQVHCVLEEAAHQCTIMNFESSPWTCPSAEFGVQCEVIDAVDTLSGTLEKGDVPPKKDPVRTLQYLLGPFPQVQIK